jgi:N-acetylglucosaminyl-diphospho-decaprenol L-rhamnosyltransferase
MSHPTVLTIILNYKTAPMTKKSIAAALVAMDGLSGEITVVDNASQDGSFEALSDYVDGLGPDLKMPVRVLASGHNGGFGAGNNVGIRAGLRDGMRPDYIYVLNSDAFPDKDAIRVLLEHLQSNPSAGFAGSYIHGEDGDTHLTTFRFPSILSELEGAIRFGPVSRLLANYAVPIETPTEPRTVDWLAGASIMMRQSVLDDIGLFDEVFFLYFEETDLCRRAHLAGHKTVFVPHSKVTHIGSVSTGMKTWDRVPGYWFASRRYYLTKNHGRVYAALATVAHITGGGLNWFRCFLTRKRSGTASHFLRTLAWHDLTAPRKENSSPPSALASTPHPATGE